MVLGRRVRPNGGDAWAANGLILGRDQVGWGLGGAVYALALASGLLAAAGALAMVLGRRVRPNGGDAWAFAVLLLLSAWTLASWLLP